MVGAHLTMRHLDRKLQIQTQIPLVDRQRNWGFHHITRLCQFICEKKGSTRRTQPNYRQAYQYTSQQGC